MTEPDTLSLDERSLARFLAKIDKQPGGCWLWKGAAVGDGTSVIADAMTAFRAGGVRGHDPWDGWRGVYFWRHILEGETPPDDVEALLDSLVSRGEMEASTVNTGHRVWRVARA